MPLIKSISYLDAKNKRHRVRCDSYGRFNFPIDKGNSSVRKYVDAGQGRYKPSGYGLRAMSFIEAVKEGDPVLELEDGYRVRVCQGGSPEYIRTDAKCVCDYHDDYYRKKLSGG